MKQVRITALAAAMALVVGLGSQAKATTLYDLINTPGATLVSGDLVFSDFTNFVLGSGSQVVDPNQITVQAVVDNVTGASGIGFFFYQPSGLQVAAGGLASFSFDYAVSSVKGITSAIEAIKNYAPLGPGVYVGKTVTDDTGVDTLANLVAYTPKPLRDAASFAAQDKILVTDSMYINGGSAGITLNRVDQYYGVGRNAVPEPSSVIMMGMGAATLGGLVLRRRRATV